MSTPTHSPLSPLHVACDAVFPLDGPALVGLVAVSDPTADRSDVDRGFELVDGPVFGLPEDLIGFRAPPSWSGLAIVTTGTARSFDDGSATRARVTFALDRSGHSAGTVTTCDETVRISAGSGPDAEQPFGHLVDVCHRILDLPAAPEPSTPNDAVLATWLTDVLAAADTLGEGFVLDDWPAVLGLHPLGGAVTRTSWADLHAALVGVGAGWSELTADELDWMDAPTWARFVLALAPPLPVLVSRIRQRASTYVSHCVHTLVDQQADSVRAEPRGGQ